MRKVCTGWFRDKSKARVHTDVRVLEPGDDDPPSHGMCSDCIHAFIAQIPPACTCPEHKCHPDSRQRERYPVGKYKLCAFCYAHGHAAPTRMRYAGLLP